MRTGIKTLYYKLSSYIKYPDQFLKASNPTIFPKFGSSDFKLNLKLRSVESHLKFASKQSRLNEIHGRPHSFALKVWNKLLPYNPNNLGNWSKLKYSEVFGTQKTEWTLIRMMINLYGGNQNDWEGYVTSGASDSNLYSMWLGRNYLLRNSKIDQMCVIQNDLTHYSIPKSSDILNLNVFNSEISRDTWTFDLESLESNIKNKISKGYKSFILPLTSGYAQTGTSDNYRDIVNLLKKLKKSHKINYFVFIDAALNGLVSPFIESDYQPLKFGGVDSINVDFHKFGMVPFPCGIVLYRKNLRKSIESSVPFLRDNDSTLSGSRSGIAPTAALMVLTALGKTGFTDAVNRSLKYKNKFIDSLRSKKSEYPDIEVINEKNSLTIGLVSKKPLSHDYLVKMGLYAHRTLYHFKSKKEYLYIYKATFIK